MAYHFKACTKCRGDVITANDDDIGPFSYCLACGKRFYLPVPQQDASWTKYDRSRSRSAVSRSARQTPR